MPWWRHQMETFSALLAICAGNSPVPGEFPAQRPVTQSFDVFFDLRLNKRLSKQSRDWWFETAAWSLWRHRNASVPNMLLPNQMQFIHALLLWYVNKILRLFAMLDTYLDQSINHASKQVILFQWHVIWNICYNYISICSSCATLTQPPRTYKSLWNDCKICIACAHQHIFSDESNKHMFLKTQSKIIRFEIPQTANVDMYKYADDRPGLGGTK